MYIRRRAAYRNLAQTMCCSVGSVWFGLAGYTVDTRAKIWKIHAIFLLSLVPV